MRRNYNIRIERTDNPTPEKGWDYRAYDLDKLDYDSIQGLGSDPEDALRDLETQMAEKGERRHGHVR